MECRGKLQSHNQAIASKDLSPSTWLEILYFLFADATDRRHRRHFAGAAAASRSQLVGAPAVKKHPAHHRRLIETGADYYP